MTIEDIEQDADDRCLVLRSSLRRLQCPRLMSCATRSTRNASRRSSLRCSPSATANWRSPDLTEVSFGLFRQIVGVRYHHFPSGFPRGFQVRR